MNKQALAQEMIKTAAANMMYSTELTKQAGMDKQALLARLLSLPVRAFSKRHADAVYNAVQPRVERAARTYSSVLNTPLNEVEWLPNALRRVGGVQIVPKFVRNKTQSQAFRDAFEHFPLMGATQFSPLPGSTATYLLASKGLKRILGEDPGPSLKSILRGDTPAFDDMRLNPLSQASALRALGGGGFGGAGVPTSSWSRYIEDV